MLRKLAHYPLLLINFVLEASLGLSMIIKPELIMDLGGVRISEILLRTCGLLALAVAFFSVSSIFLIQKHKNINEIKSFVYANLLIFNLALTVGLFYAAITGEITYLGTIIHLPLAVCFGASLITSYHRTNQK